MLSSLSSSLLFGVCVSCLTLWCADAAIGSCGCCRGCKCLMLPLLLVMLLLSPLSVAIVFVFDACVFVSCSVCCGVWIVVFCLLCVVCVLCRLM